MERGGGDGGRRRGRSGSKYHARTSWVVGMARKLKLAKFFGRRAATLVSFGLWPYLFLSEDNYLRLCTRIIIIK
jgi:hypothetical protein